MGTPNTDNWTGSRNTAPDTPTGLVMLAMTKPATNPSKSRSKAHLRLVGASCQDSRIALISWLTSAQAAELLGVSVVAVNKRCRRGRLPFVEKAGRRWFRRDHLELVRHADLVKRPARRAAPRG